MTDLRALANDIHVQVLDIGVPDQWQDAIDRDDMQDLGERLLLWFELSRFSVATHLKFEALDFPTRSAVLESVACRLIASRPRCEAVSRSQFRRLCFQGVPVTMRKGS